MKTNQDPAWQAKLATILKEHAEGDVIPHQELDSILGLEEPRFKDYESSNEWKKALQTFQFVRLAAIQQLENDLLVVHQVYIKNVRGEGYRIVPAKDQASEAYKATTRNIHDEFEFGTLVLDNIRETALNAEERKSTNDVRAKFSLLQHLFESNRRL